MVARIRAEEPWLLDTAALSFSPAQIEAVEGGLSLESVPLTLDETPLAVGDAPVAAPGRSGGGERLDPRSDTDRTASAPMVRFGKHKLVLTEEQAEELERRIQAYIKDNGTTIGFIAELLGV